MHTKLKFTDQSILHKCYIETYMYYTKFSYSNDILQLESPYARESEQYHYPYTLKLVPSVLRFNNYLIFKITYISKNFINIFHIMHTTAIHMLILFYIFNRKYLVSKVEKFEELSMCYDFQYFRSAHKY